MAVNKSYKEGGSGKGVATRDGLDLKKFGDNLDKTHGTRQDNCLDCVFFRGINNVKAVKCLEDKKHVGLKKCSDDFVKK